MKKKILFAMGGLLLVAGCSPAMVQPGSAPLPPPKAAATAEPVTEQTVADPNYTISDQCRAELAAQPLGPAILDRYDVWFGYWKTQGNPPNEVTNTANGFRFEAKAAGATTC